MKQHKKKEVWLIKEVNPIVKQHKKVLIIPEAKPRVGTFEEYLRVRCSTTNHNLPLNYTM
jgi:hypothetical protein